MIFKLGGITVNVKLMDLLAGDGISFEINGEISPYARIDLYVDYAPKALTKFDIRGSITEVVKDETEST